MNAAQVRSVLEFVRTGTAGRSGRVGQPTDGDESRLTAGSRRW